MRLVLLKSLKFANQAGYYLLNGRWHKTSQDKPAPKGVPVSAHPHAAGKPVQKETLADHEWGQLKLPAENVNAGTFNKQLDQLKAAAAAGDVTGILGSGYGTNTYGKKLAIIANHVLGLLGSDHKVTPGQKAGTHAAVQTAPEIEAEAPAPKPQPKPEPKAEVKPDPKPEPKAEDKPAPAPEKKADAELAVPEFAEGKQAKGVKAHYEKVAKKVIRAAKAGDLSALQFMVKPENGNTWKGKTDNSKALLELHAQAVEHAQAMKGPGKDVQHPDAEKKAAQEAKELAKEGVKLEPEQKPEPKKKPTLDLDAASSASKDSIKAGDFPGLKYNPNLKSEAEAGLSNGVIQVGDKFFDIASSESKKHILVHEQAHYDAHKIGESVAMDMAQAGYFGPLTSEGTIANGPNGQFVPDECLTEALTIYKEDPAWLKDKYPKAYAAVHSFAQSGEISSSILTDISEGAKKHQDQMKSDSDKVEAAIATLKQIYESQPDGSKKDEIGEIFKDVFFNKVISPEAKALLDGAKNNLGIGPKEGETKQGADGTLVFKNGRWHKQGETQKAEQKPAAKEQPKGDAAGKLSQIPWDGMLLPDSNKNAKSHNKQVAKIKAMAEAGDIEGLKNFKAGVNTYGKKQNLLAQTALAALEESASAPKAEAKPAPAEKPKAETAPADGIPKPPKMGAFNHGLVAKQWVKFAQEGKSQELMDSISTLAGNAKKTPEKFSDPDSVKLMQFAGEMANWAANNMAAPDNEPASSVLADMPQKPGGSSPMYEKIEQAMMDADSDKLAEIIEMKSEFADQPSFSPNKKSYEYAKAAYKYVMGSDYVSPAKAAAPAADGLPQKPANVGKWTDTVNALEGWAKSGDLTEAENMYYDLYSLVDEMPDAMPVLHYAQDVVAHIKKNNPEQGSASTENDGPKEGETKQGADGMLVFKNGRWHKMGDEKSAEKPAAKTPADVEIPEFTGLSPNHLNSMNKAAAALKAKIAAEGKAGFKSVLTNHKDGKVTVTIDGIKISKASVTSASPAFAAFAKFVDELKASTGAKKKAKPAPKATQAPAPAAEPEQAKPIESMDGWEQTGSQGGSNPGGKFKDADGVEWYCKFPENDHIAKAEVLAAKLYSALGLNAQDAKLVTKDGKVGIASRWQDVKKASPKELAQTPGVLEGFAADAWLANWDVVGLAYDNLQVDDKGNAMRVDAGGSLMYRAQGSKKAFGEHVTELDSLRDPKINPQAAAVFGKMSEADITASVAKVAQISDAQIRIMVNNFGPGDKAERKALAETLIARKNDLIAKYPKAVKVKKKRLDPENLPVKEERLPKAHDFANWNGPGAGLSGKAAVNAANQKVESEMLAIAKSGNLTKLKDYKFQPVDVATGEPKGEPVPVGQHPSKHVQQFHQDLIQALDEIANPPQPLKIFQESDLNTLDELDMAFPSKKFGTTVNAVHSNEKMGFWVVLGGVHKAAEKFMPKKITHFTTQAIDAAYQKFKEGSKLAKHFVLSVQASGSYNDLFREGKEMDHAGNKLSDVAKAAEEFATEQPEGTAVYRWQHMTKDMVDKIMGAPDGTVFQATGPMCTSMSPTATSHFGPHRIKIIYAKGAKAVESFGSGKFAGEKEVTTLPNSRFVILKKEMVPGGSGKRLELEVLMLPPDLGL